MPPARIPNALEMKTLKYGGRPDAEKDAVASALREAGRRSEALLLFEGRAEHPQLKEEKVWALEEGATFHLLALRRLGVAITAEDFTVCAHSAEKKGRWLDARLSWLELDRPEEIRRIAAHLPPSLRPEPESSEEAEEA